MQSCPCQSGKLYHDCCEPIIQGKTIAINAEQLMRSRYTAYCISNIDYLMKSHHKSTRPIKERNEILQWSKSVKWMSLQIIKTSKGTITDSEGWVEFKALFVENGALQSIHENSYFIKENERWFYKNGQHY